MKTLMEERFIGDEEQSWLKGRLRETRNIAVSLEISGNRDQGSGIGREVES
jgi:hypothetical protein